MRKLRLKAEESNFRIIPIHPNVFSVSFFTLLCVPYVLCIPPNCFSVIFLFSSLLRLRTHSSFLLFCSCVYLWIFKVSLCFSLVFLRSWLFYVAFLLYDASIKSYRVFHEREGSETGKRDKSKACGLD